MSQEQAASEVAQWRSAAGKANPAGPLFSGGQYTEAELRMKTGRPTNRCGTACTWSATRYCC
ncbi:hypothetical protein F4553_002440 [Allocatelliglobosispora scoriae]|uniref:Uncharacterized protein n=1 Tax=Allocatelliglobosispora scoriae TaxID=643052 RepID=A0A841BQF6_9ACTN|nr:DUF6229 family protein [Allocatelliglobosispora scoriae]MBB5869061.1 hypothetical protein [Allocatelliglobosispora scoriae]